MQILEYVRVGSELRALLFRIGDLLDGHDPLRGPLKERVSTRPVCERPSNLYAGRAGSDDADPSAIERDVVVPLRAVE